MNRFRIRTQLFFLIAMICVFFTVALSVAGFSLHQTAKKFGDFVDRDQALLLAQNEIYAQGLQLGQGLRNMLLNPEDGAARKNYAKARESIQAAMASASAHMERDGGGRAEDFQRIKVAGDNLFQIQERVIASIAENNIDGAKTMLTAEETPAWREFKQLVLDSIEKQRQQVVQSKARVEEGAVRAEIVTAIVAVITAVLGLIVANAIVHNVVSGLRVAIQSAERIASGRLNEAMPRHGKNEIGMLLSSMEKMRENLRSMVVQIQSSAVTLVSSAVSMASASDQVAAAAVRQSDAASDIAATIEEMTVSVNHVADRASEANELSSQSGSLAIKGEAVIGQAVESINLIASTVQDTANRMQELETHSNRISNVVSVISEVADQTNLLALNAAIEAARAGEQGRGFAVVADEVRKLAERTTTSTREIAATIQVMRDCATDAVSCMQEAVTKVERGVGLAQEADISIKQIGEESRKTVGMVEEISASIREQGSATNNIAIQIEKIAQMSEQSSDAAKDGARTAHALSELTEKLRQYVSVYSL